MPKSLILLIYCLWCSLSGHTQLFNANKLDSLFFLLEKHQKFMGSVALYKEGRLLYSNAVGFIDSAGGSKSTTETRYRIGSISKTFTSVLVMKSVEKGRIKLDDSLARWFPQINNAGRITIRHMLGHRSGIANFTNSPQYLLWNTRPQSVDSILSRIIEGGTNFEPGAAFEYSNSAYYLLGLILEKTNKKTYKQLLTDEIIDPLDLRNTYYGGQIDLSNNECRSFEKDSLWQMATETDMSVPFAAGAVVSTPKDICLFATALFEGNLVSSQSLQAMKSFQQNVGLGLFVFPFYGRAGFGHTGGIDAFRSVFTYFPEGRVTYALFSNGTDYDNNEISISVLRAAYGEDFVLPDFSVRPSEAIILPEYLGVFANPKLPIKLTFSVQGKKLMCQATGQPAFELNPSGTNMFRQDKYGIAVEFIPDERQWKFQQGGQSFLFSKVKE